MLARSPEFDRARPVSVNLFRLAGAAVPDDLAQRLGREVVEVHASAGQPPLCEPPDSTVAVLYLPVAVDETTLRELVSWAAGAERPVGLIGCCGGGNARVTEAGLAAGFDDFVVASISPRELAGRIRALARRVRAPLLRARDKGRFGTLRLDLSRHQVLLGNRRITLTRTELLVMQALVAAQGRAISRGEILDTAWGDDSFEIGERAVDNVIMRLRRKLGDPELIVTVRGVGFRLAER